MAYWVVQGRDAHTVHEGDTWLDALPGALQELGIDLPSVRIATGIEGCLRVADPQGAVVALIRPGLDDQEAADGLLDALGPVAGDFVEVFDQPLEQTEQALPSDIAERLFEKSQPIEEAPTDEHAAHLAVELLVGVTPAEAASVIFAGLDQDRFEFLAAVGPAAEFVRNVTLPFGQGHVGTVHDTGVAVLLHDVAHSARHWHAVDDASGFTPRSLVAVPIRSSDGRSWGVIELLSTDDRFFSWHVTAADHVATALAERLATSRPA